MAGFIKIKRSEEMILGFKPQFKDKILKGSKIHTIREDKNKRWKTGNTIHFATGVRTKNYECFMKGECISVQDIVIKLYRSGMILISVDGKLPLHKEQALYLINHDGFNDFDDFYDFFILNYCLNPNTFKVLTIKAKLIHWTNYKY